MKLKLLTGIAITAALTICSCDDTTGDLGTSLTNDMDKLGITTAAFDVSTRSIIADSVLSRNTTVYLGKIRDPETGAYITANGMIQFHTLEDYTFPDAADIVSKLDGQIIADSCEIRLYYTDYYGDSLAAMKMTAYEMNKPMPEGVNYYSNYDPMQHGYINGNGFAIDKMYSLTDMNVSESQRDTTGYAPNIKIKLDKQYTDKDGATYNNYGTYIMHKFYENSANFKNSYNFIHNVVPGFYFKNQSGLGSMAYVNVSQLNVYFRYNVLVTSSSGAKDSLVTYGGTASFAGTEEVLQTTTVTNDNGTMKQLADDNTCTYLKTPAGIFTEMTLPIDDIVAGHENDTINTAKIVLTRINNSTSSEYALNLPKTLLMIPEDSLYSFFEHDNIANYKNSFIASFDKSTSSSYSNTYTFNNISGLVSQMAHSSRLSDRWNKVVIIPVTVSTSGSTGSITEVVHDMSLTSTKLVGGNANPNAPVKIELIYSKFKNGGQLP